MKKIVILSGGTGAEIEVAKKSAEFFKKNLKRDYDYYELPKQLDSFLENKDKYNLAIPVFHWEYWEDGRMFAFLDILGIEHKLSPYNTHALCLDKDKSNFLAQNLWVKTPKHQLLLKEDNYKYDLEKLDFPVILKPNKWGSSFFTFKIQTEQELKERIKQAKTELDDDIMLQEYIVWAEYSVSMIHWKTLPIMKLEKQNKQDFFDYDAKYEQIDSIKETWPSIEKELENSLKSQSKRLYKYFGVKWFCRIDFLVEDDVVYFLEINTIPWTTDASIFPQSWEKTWKSFEELVEELIK